MGIAYNTFSTYNTIINKIYFGKHTQNTCEVSQQPTQPKFTTASHSVPFCGQTMLQSTSQRTPIRRMRQNLGGSPVENPKKDHLRTSFKVKFQKFTSVTLDLLKNNQLLNCLAPQVYSHSYSSSIQLEFSI